MRIFMRIVLYGLLLVLFSQLLMWDAAQNGVEIKFLEATFTEWTQQICLLLMAISFAFTAKKYPRLRSLSILLAGFSLIGLVREYNNFFNTEVFDGAWQLLALAVSMVTGYLLWRNQEDFWTSLQEYSTTLSFGILLAGFLSTLVFSRLFGRTVFWETLMEERYFRP